MRIIIVAIIALINPTLGFLLAIVGLIGDKHNWKTYIFCISLFFANASYCYTPESSSPDLYRYFEYVLSLRGNGFIETLTNGYEGTTLYTFNFMVWISNLFHDEHLLPAMSVFLVYYIALYCTCKTGIIENSKWKYVVSVAFFQMMTLDWYSLTNNVRNILAFAIIGYAVYRDVYLKKKNIPTYFLYIIPFFLHPTAILFVFARLALSISQRRTVKNLIIVATLLINPVVDFLHSVMFRVTANPYMLLVINKAYNYLFDTSTAYGLAVRASLRSTVTRVFYLSLITIIIVFSIEKGRLEKKSSVEKPTKNSNYFSTYLVITCLLALACTTMLRPEYWRFSATAIIFSSIMLLPLLTYSEKHVGCKALKILGAFLSSGCFMLWMYQFTWFNSLELLSNSLINSPIFVVIKAIYQFCGGI